MPLARRFRRLRVAFVALVPFVAYPAESRSQLSPAERAADHEELDEADQLRTQKKYEPAIRLLEETLARVRRSARPGEDAIGGVAFRLGAAYHDAGQFEKAEPILREAVAIGRAQSGKAGDFRYPAFRALSRPWWLEKYDEAVVVSEESLKEFEARYGVDDWQTNMARDSARPRLLLDQADQGGRSALSHLPEIRRGPVQGRRPRDGPLPEQAWRRP